MCGIIGCISQNDVKDKLLEGLRRLAYRGYDSVGLVVTNHRGSFRYEKLPVKIAELETRVKNTDLSGHLGLGHTRWATHGMPSRENAHPHFSCNHKIALVHNGIIENYEELRKRLIKLGHQFSSQTDTESIVHLIEEYRKSHPLPEAIRRAVRELVGSFALGIISSEIPETLFGARANSPLVIGVGQNESFLASDIPAILPYTRRVIFLNDGELVRLTTDKIIITDFAGRRRRPRLTEINWNITTAEKGGYPHFMLKEIFEQPEAVQSSISYYINKATQQSIFRSLVPWRARLKKIKRVIITACGTAWHAALVGKYALEELSRLPTEVAIASEFRYSQPVLNRETLLVAVSQSGETADTLAAVRLAKSAKAVTLALCNVVGSSLTREADETIYTYAGPEISVASTKAYTCQLAVLALLAIYLGRLRGRLAPATERRLIKELGKIPAKLREVLAANELIRHCARAYSDRPNFMYIGRRYNFPNAYEGALKLKEISYTHAEGYGAGEMKHGPLALVEPTFPTVALAVKSVVYDKMLSNIKEIKARQGIVISIATQGDTQIADTSDYVIFVPETEEIFSPILTVVPLQLLAYHIAVAKGCEVDQPRNLAKSVTVE